MGPFEERGDEIHLPERWAVLEQALAEIANAEPAESQPDAEDDED